MSEVVYVVTRGCYSDYSVLAAFADHATAKAWADALNVQEEDGWRNDECHVETRALIAAGTPPHKVTTYSSSVEFWDDGRIERRDIHASVDWAIDTLWGPPPTRPHLRFVRAPCHGGRGGRLDIRADSAEAIEKVVSDRIAMWKAGAWVTKSLDEWTNDAEVSP